MGIVLIELRANGPAGCFLSLPPLACHHVNCREVKVIFFNLIFFPLMSREWGIGGADEVQCNHGKSSNR